ncbi:hypothetical protein [Suipraeoptans intestinalis]|uniref:hypothetical protein n=1 Tax=Suipraeoptans intestinalis TaxID=2606628 RepID=UPI0023F0E73D|nr:hypothetical protein [Suipraeoptans intestinalis]MDY3122762.1 hypothetical protein [Suipraeoptans intestinalis]
MYTSDPNKQRHQKTAVLFLALSVFCVALTLIYEQFSYGQFSPYMRLMFLIPLLLGTVPALIRSRFRIPYRPNASSTYFWNMAIALFLNGCLIKSIIEISGRFTSYDRMYWIGGTICIAASLLLSLLSFRPKKRKKAGEDSPAFHSLAK